MPRRVGFLSPANEQVLASSHPEAAFAQAKGLERYSRGAPMAQPGFLESSFGAASRRYKDEVDGSPLPPWELHRNNSETSWSRLSRLSTRWVSDTIPEVAKNVAFFLGDQAGFQFCGISVLMAETSPAITADDAPPVDDSPRSAANANNRQQTLAENQNRRYDDAMRNPSQSCDPPQGRDFARFYHIDFGFSSRKEQRSFASLEPSADIGPNPLKDLDLTEG
jgi:hypothetical protein